MNNQHNHTPKNSSTHLQNGHNLNTPLETVNPDAVSYEEGYVHGRASERSLENQEQEVRSENSASRGLLLGMALTSLVGLTVGAIFYLNQREESPTPTPVLVPARPAPQQPNRETTIIERTTEKIQPSAPINQEPPTAPAPQQSQPDIRIIVPNSGQQSAPSPQNSTPQTAPTQSQSQPVSPNPPLSQPNTSRGTSTTTQPNTSNQDSPAPSQKQIPTVTIPTEQPDTTNQTSSEPAQNQTQSTDSSNSDQ
jgi:hypothetical protein